MNRFRLPTIITLTLIFVLWALDVTSAAGHGGFGLTGHSTLHWTTRNHAEVFQPLKRNSQTKHPTPEEIWKGIKSAAQKEADSNSPLIIPPQFSVKYVGSIPQLTIVKGDVSDLGFGDDPYELPFKKQILIEALRRALPQVNLSGANNTRPKQGVPDPAVDSDSTKGNAKADDHWQQYLSQAEELVRKAVASIEFTADKNSLKGTLQEAERQIDEILYDKIYGAVEQEAQRKGYNIIYGRGGEEIKKFSVSINTDPGGAKIWVMSAIVYRKQLITKADPSQWPWVEVVQNPYGLLGRYRYRAVWPDGRRAEGDIEVNNQSPIKLLPE